MKSNAKINLSRACPAIGIPNGVREVLPQGSTVRVTQSLGTSYTVVDQRGYMFRIDEQDADALGISTPKAAQPSGEGTFSEQAVWDQLKTIFDPEIPVNIVDLGLIYSCEISSLEQGGKKIDVEMSLTAPGCGMADVLKAEVESKLARLPEVKEVRVEVVFDPPWSPGRMSEAAKLQLGFDLDYGTGSPFPTI
jgi:probable FeS assembly SUF system protein SufT